MVPAVEFVNISKRFGSLPANHDISFAVQKGSIHCVIGENGAGKSTLMKILFGAYTPDSGTIKVNGAEVGFRSSHDAIAAGIGMLYQHFMLIDDFTILENVILGNEPVKGFSLDIKSSKDRLNELIQTYGLGIDLKKKIEFASISEQQKTEILKLLYRNSDILIFDEPTAVLSPVEVSSFFNILKKFKEQGKTIILITHKLKEVEAVADHVTILRRGRVVMEAPAGSINEDQLGKAIVGDVNFEKKISHSRKDIPVSAPVIELSKVSLREDNIKKLDSLDLILRKGEIHGICGVEGNGQNEIIEIITGLNENYTGIVNKPVDEISHVPDDRLKKGMIKEFNIGENIILKEKRSGFVTGSYIDTISENISMKYDVRLPSINSPLGSLSGGNQQKVIFAREIEQQNEILIFSHPTRGVDINASRFIYNKIVDQRNEGKAVLLVSSDIDELMDLSDKISVIFNGRIVKTFFRNEFGSEDNAEREKFLNIAGKLMIGAKVD